MTAVVLTFDYPERGVTLQATSSTDIIVHVDPDQMINYFTENVLERKPKIKPPKGPKPPKPFKTITKTIPSTVKGYVKPPPPTADNDYEEDPP